jgi:hypothetical protein
MLTRVLFCVFSEEILAILQYQNGTEVNGMTLEKLIRDSCVLWEKAISNSLSSNCLIVKLWCQQLNQLHVISCPFIAQRTGTVCLIVLLPREILCMVIEANFRNWNGAQHESMTKFFHDMNTEGRNQPLSHIVFRASKFTNWKIVTCWTAHY